MPVHETQITMDFDGCVVTVNGPDEAWFYTYCGLPVVGERGPWRMCRKHYDLFDPDRRESDIAPGKFYQAAGAEPDCIEQPKIAPVVFVTIIVMIVAIVALLVFAAWQGASADPSTHLR